MHCMKTKTSPISLVRSPLQAMTTDAATANDSDQVTDDCN